MINARFHGIVPLSYGIQRSLYRWAETGKAARRSSRFSNISLFVALSSAQSPEFAENNRVHFAPHFLKFSEPMEIWNH